MEPGRLQRAADRRSHRRSAASAAWRSPREGSNGMSGTAAGATDVQGRTSVKQYALDLQRRAPVLQILALVVLFIYGTMDIEGFGMWGNVKSMLTLAALLALASLGQTLVVILGGIDLSVPGFIVMGAIV